MIKKLTAEEKRSIYEEIREFLADELEVPLDKIGPNTKIIEDLNGDSMIYLELIEEFRMKYDVSIEVRILGHYFREHPIFTVQETANAIYDIVERGDTIVKEKTDGPPITQ